MRSMRDGAGETRSSLAVLRLLGSVARLAMRRPFDTLATLTAAVGTTAIVVNALQLQRGPHPAPLMAPAQAFSRADSTGSVMTLPRPRPAAETQLVLPRDASPTDHSRSQLITEIQRELLRRGFYDGTVDGLYGPRIDVAIREFERLSGLRPMGEPTEEVLQALQQSSLKAKPRTLDKSPTAPTVKKADTAHTSRVVAIQRALSDYGFGQVKPTGTMDPPTKAAIEKFERSRKLPVTGRLSAGVTREIAAVTGRPLD